MGVVGLLALLANAGVALMLYRYRGGDANMRSVWICSRNDAIGNVAVLLAAAGVFGTGTGWPDLIVAAIMAALGHLAAAGRSSARPSPELRRALPSRPWQPEYRMAHDHAITATITIITRRRATTGPSPSASALNLAYVVVEAVFGLLAGSLALLADAGHNLSDVLGLVLAWGAAWLARRAAHAAAHLRPAAQLDPGGAGQRHAAAGGDRRHRLGGGRSGCRRPSRWRPGSCSGSRPWACWSMAGPR